MCKTKQSRIAAEKASTQIANSLCNVVIDVKSLSVHDNTVDTHEVFSVKIVNNVSSQRQHF